MCESEGLHSEQWELSDGHKGCRSHSQRASFKAPFTLDITAVSGDPIKSGQPRQIITVHIWYHHVSLAAACDWICEQCQTQQNYFFPFLTLILLHFIQLLPNPSPSSLLYSTLSLPSKYFTLFLITDPFTKHMCPTTLLFSTKPFQPSTRPTHTKNTPINHSLWPSKYITEMIIFIVD